jgi:glycine/D-amino acid oxidase-like deaminating enzyme
MIRTRYGLSPWLQTFPRSRRPDQSRLRGEQSSDIAIIGGGLTGCATAYACAAAGLNAIVLEAGSFGQGGTARSAGLLLPEPGPDFRDVAKLHGLRAARRMFELWRRASLDGAALIRRLGISCGLEPGDSLTVASWDGEKALRQECDARERAGLGARWVHSAAISKTSALETAGGLRLGGCFTFDPYRACLGLASSAAKRGARVFERSPVKKVRVGSKQVEVVAEGGLVRAATVIVCTGTATAEYQPLRRHFKRREKYLVMTEPVPAAIRKQLGSRGLTVGDTATPRHRIRWTRDHRLLVTGADQAETPARKRHAVLIQRTGQLMYELLRMYPAISGLQPEYGWESVYGETADGLIYIGPHRNYPRHLFALGGGADSMTGAFLASRLLARAASGTPDKGDDVFGWTR